MVDRRGRAALGAVTICFVCAWLLPSAALATAPYVRGALVESTPWTRSVSSTLPLASYPRPQLQRSQWLNLNGRWQYQQAQAGQAPPFGANLAQTILVPFPVQSPLSGIERNDTRGWYQRTFRVPASWGARRVRLNFGAVSWDASVYVNGRLVGSHRGDYDAFSLDITGALRRHGVNQLLVGYVNPIGGAGEPVGKQIPSIYSVYHTASSGIWQTVWLEPVSATHITRLTLIPDLPHSRLVVTALTSRTNRPRVLVQALADGRVIARAAGAADRPFGLRILRPHLWSPEDPFLYSLRVRLLDRGQVVDRVQSYFGMRSIALARVDGVVRPVLNGHFIFQTGTLDQGFWPDGLYTAPSDAALRFDIAAAKGLGYNMIRKHVKVEPDRWYYWADRLGILVWQDMPNMPVVNVVTPAAELEFRRELHAIVLQHLSDPSIVTWVPFNEGWGQFDVGGVTRQLKQWDPSRLVDSQSGSANCCHAIEAPNSDIRDTHLYSGPYAPLADHRASATGEYGGLFPLPSASHLWPTATVFAGPAELGITATSVAGLLRRQYAQLTQEMRTRGLSGAVYTELAGYEQELGILTYDRRQYTIDPGLVRRLNRRLVAASQRTGKLRPQPALVPGGASGVWHFDEGRGTFAKDSSGEGHPLTLQGGASWTTDEHGSALLVTGDGQRAVAGAAVVDPRHSFTVSAWLSTRQASQSGSAVSQPGPGGASFSLGIRTGNQVSASIPGIINPPGRHYSLTGTWWTFSAPASPDCAPYLCGTPAGMLYDDNRTAPQPGSWHQLTGVYDAPTSTTSLYVDGISQDTEHVVGAPRALGPLTVGAGAGAYTTSNQFVGAIDELRTYSRALTPADAWRLYRAELALRKP